MGYSYTPQQLEDYLGLEEILANEVLQQAHEKKWYIFEDIGEEKQSEQERKSTQQNALINDLHRLHKLNGQSCTNQDPENIKHAVCKFLNDNTTMFDRLCEHYNQRLLGFPIMVLRRTIPQTRLVKGKPLEIFYFPTQAVERNTELHLTAGGDDVMVKTEYIGLEYPYYANEDDDEPQKQIIPGHIEMKCVWDSEEGFRLDRLNYSNTILRDLNFKRRKTLLTKEELREEACLAYAEEIRVAIDKANGVSPFLDELLLVIQRKVIDISDPRVARPFLIFFNILSSGFIKAEERLQYTEAVTDILYYYPKMLDLKLLGSEWQCSNSFIEEEFARVLASLAGNNLRKSVGRCLLEEINQINKEDLQHEDRVLLARILLQTSSLIIDPEPRTTAIDLYQQFAQAISCNSTWGKAVAETMFHVVFAVEFVKAKSDKGQQAYKKTIGDEKLLSPSARYHLVKTMLGYALSGEGDPVMRRAAGNVLQQVESIKKQYPEHDDLFAQAVWQTLRLFSDPTNDYYKDEYYKLAYKISKHHWGKVIVHAMLSLVLLAVFTLCCVSLFSPIGLSFICLIPMMMTSGLGFALDIGFFAQRVNQHSRFKGLSETMGQSMDTMISSSRKD